VWFQVPKITPLNEYVGNAIIWTMQGNIDLTPFHSKITFHENYCGTYKVLAYRERMAKKFFAGDGFVAKSQQSPPRWALAGHADVKLSTR